MASYQVTGTLSPDVTGVYTDAGELNGERYYSKDVSGTTWYIGYNTSVEWFLSTVAGEPPIGVPYWSKGGSGIAGEYLPAEGATGTATVAEYASPPALSARLMLVIQSLNGEPLPPRIDIPISEIQ